MHYIPTPSSNGVDVGKPKGEFVCPNPNQRRGGQVLSDVVMLCVVNPHYYHDSLI